MACKIFVFMVTLMAMVCSQTWLSMPNVAEASSLHGARLGILPICNKASLHSDMISPDHLDGATYALSEAMDNPKLDFFEIMDRSEIEKIFQEYELQQSLLEAGVMDESTRSVLRLKGVQYIAIGNIANVSREGSKVHVTAFLRLLEIETGRVLLASRGQGEASSVTDALDKAIQDLVFGKRGVVVKYTSKR